MDNSDLTALIMAGNQAAMEWYSLASQKPLPRAPANSVMGAIVGTDFGPAGRYGSAPATLGGGVIILALVALAAVMLLRK